MIKAFLFSISLLMTTLLVYSQQAANEAFFYQGSFEQLQQEAKTQNKPYFVYFYRDGCKACAKMERETFSNKWLKIYQEARYMPPFKAQAFSLYSDYLVKKYEVDSYPQICVFSQNGKLVRRIKSAISAKNLIETLRFYERTLLKPDTTENMMAQDANPTLSLQLQEASAFTGLYKFSIRKQEPEANALAVQIGVFKNYKHMISSVLELDQNWHDNIMVGTQNIDSVDYFRLLLGPFYSIEHAQSYQSSLKKKHDLHGLILKLIDMSPYVKEQDEEVFSIDKHTLPTEPDVNDDTKKMYK